MPTEIYGTSPSSIGTENETWSETGSETLTENENLTETGLVAAPLLEVAADRPNCRCPPADPADPWALLSALAPPPFAPGLLYPVAPLRPHLPRPPLPRQSQAVTERRK